jgi:hypothetical protein
MLYIAFIVSIAGLALSLKQWFGPDIPIQQSPWFQAFPQVEGENENDENDSN